MPETTEEDNPENEQIAPLLRTPTSEEKRLRAKENLERAKRVLAESGQQLKTNKQSDSRPPEQAKHEATHDEKE